MLKKILVLGGVAAPLMANAAVDASITTAISTAQTDGVAVAVAMTVLGATVWGALFIKRKFFG